MRCAYVHGISRSVTIAVTVAIATAVGGKVVWVEGECATIAIDLQLVFVSCQ